MVYPDNYENINAIYECLEQQVCFDENLPILPYDHIGNGLVFMQCTGLKDQNGKLIYEGDIVKMINTEVNFEQVRLVVFKDCAFQFNLPNSMQIDKPLYCWAINYLNHYKHIDLEVIGNIYENPELLEEN